MNNRKITAGRIVHRQGEGMPMSNSDAAITRVHRNMKALDKKSLDNRFSAEYKVLSYRLERMLGLPSNRLI